MTPTLAVLLPGVLASQWWRPSGWLPRPPFVEVNDVCRGLYTTKVSQAPDVYTTGCLAESTTNIVGERFGVTSSEACVKACFDLQGSGASPLLPRMLTTTPAVRPGNLSVAGASNGCWGQFKLSSSTGATDLNMHWTKEGVDDPQGELPKTGRRVLFHDGTRWRCDVELGGTRNWLCSEPTQGAQLPSSISRWEQTCDGTVDQNVCVSDGDGECVPRLTLAAAHNDRSAECICASLEELYVTPLNTRGGGCSSGFVVMQLPLACMWLSPQQCMIAAEDSCKWDNGCCYDAASIDDDSNSGFIYIIIVLAVSFLLIITLVVVIMTLVCRSSNVRPPRDNILRAVHAVQWQSRPNVIGQRRTSEAAREARRKQAFATVAGIMTQIPIITEHTDECPICLEDTEKGYDGLDPEDKKVLQEARRNLEAAILSAREGGGEPFGSEVEGTPEPLLSDIRRGQEDAQEDGDKGEGRNYWWGRLACGHCAHRACLEKWFLSQLRGPSRTTQPTCPLCRAVLPDVIDIFTAGQTSGLMSPLASPDVGPQAPPQQAVQALSDLGEPEAPEMPEIASPPIASPEGREGRMIEDRNRF